MQPARHVPLRLEQLRGLSAEPLTEALQRRVWNTSVADEHRQGMTIFVWSQIRALVAAESGWARVGFAAAALRLAVPLS